MLFDYKLNKAQQTKRENELQDFLFNSLELNSHLIRYPGNANRVRGISWTKAPSVQEKPYIDDVTLNDVS